MNNKKNGDGFKYVSLPSQSSEEDLKPAPSPNLLSLTQENAQEHERKGSACEDKKGATVFHPFFFSLIFFAARSMD